MGFEQGIEAYQAGDYERAVILLGQLLEEDPTQTEARLWLGASMMAQGDQDRAVFMFKRVLKEAPSAEVQAYAHQMLAQLGIEVEPTAPQLAQAPDKRLLQAKDIGFNQLMRQVCLLSDKDLNAMIPLLQLYIQDLPAFKVELSQEFRGSDDNIAVLEGLLGLDSPRRQAECKSRLQSFLNTPDRVREQILGVYVRSINPGDR